MHKNKSVDVKKFAMSPKARVPRSAFRMEQGYKTAFDSGYLVPIYCEEVLPGDHFNVNMTAFARLATPITPFMDNLWLESFFFFVPARIIWTNFKKFMGEQANPDSSISYTVPQQVSDASGYAIGSLQDYFGLPTVGQVGGGNTVSHSALPLRAYNLIYNEWFRDENLQDSIMVDLGDGPDATPSANYTLQRRGKRPDYFTSALPWVQKFTPTPLPLGTSAPIKADGGANGIRQTSFPGSVSGAAFAMHTPASAPNAVGNLLGTGATDGVVTAATALGMYADLASATSATINQFRQAMQIQEFLERDARGGTRYTEKIFGHFGVRSPDARLQRPEYLGGGKTPVIVNPISQTSSTDATTPQGNLAAMATALAIGHSFNQSFTEHGYVIGIVSVNADLTYQQGLRRHWSKSTQYDFYWPEFAHLGEQSVLNKEIYVRGDANDPLVFGYQERYAEYRYTPSQITGLMRSTAATTIDKWHLAQKFTALPTLNTTFIRDTPPVDRIVAVGSGANGQQFLFDAVFINKAARPLPMFGVPASLNRF